MPVKVKFPDGWTYTLKEGEAVKKWGTKKDLGNKYQQTVFTTKNRSITHQWAKPKPPPPPPLPPPPKKEEPPPKPEPTKKEVLIFKDGYKKELQEGEYSVGSITRTEENRIVQIFYTNKGRTISHPIGKVEPKPPPPIPPEKFIVPKISTKREPTEAELRKLGYKKEFDVKEGLKWIPPKEKLKAKKEKPVSVIYGRPPKTKKELEEYMLYTHPLEMAQLTMGTKDWWKEKKEKEKEYVAELAMQAQLQAISIGQQLRAEAIQRKKLRKEPKDVGAIQYVMEEVGKGIEWAGELPYAPFGIPLMKQKEAWALAEKKVGKGIEATRVTRIGKLLFGEKEFVPTYVPFKIVLPPTIKQLQKITEATAKEVFEGTKVKAPKPFRELKGEFPVKGIIPTAAYGVGLAFGAEEEWAARPAFQEGGLFGEDKTKMKVTQAIAQAALIAPVFAPLGAQTMAASFAKTLPMTLGGKIGGTAVEELVPEEMAIPFWKTKEGRRIVIGKGEAKLVGELGGFVAGGVTGAKAFALAQKRVGAKVTAEAVGIRRAQLGKEPEIPFKQKEFVKAEIEVMGKRKPIEVKFPLKHKGVIRPEDMAKDVRLRKVIGAPKEKEILIEKELFHEVPKTVIKERPLKAAVIETKVRTGIKGKPDVSELKAYVKPMEVTGKGVRLDELKTPLTYKEIGIEEIIKEKGITKGLIAAEKVEIPPALAKHYKVEVLKKTAWKPVPAKKVSYPTTKLTGIEIVPKKPAVSVGVTPFEQYRELLYEPSVKSFKVKWKPVPAKKVSVPTAVYEPKGLERISGKAVTRYRGGIYTAPKGYKVRIGEIPQTIKVIGKRIIEKPKFYAPPKLTGLEKIRLELLRKTRKLPTEWEPKPKLIEPKGIGRGITKTITKPRTTEVMKQITKPVTTEKLVKGLVREGEKVITKGTARAATRGAVMGAAVYGIAKVPAVIPAMKPARIPSISVKPREAVIQAPRARPISKPIAKEMEIGISLAKPVEVSIPVAKPISIVTPIATPITKPAEITKPITKPIAKPITKPIAITTPITTPITKPITRPVEAIVTTVVPIVPPPLIFPIALLPKEELMLAPLAKKKPAYKVQVKSKGKWRKASRELLPENLAFRQGGRIVDWTTSQRFRVKKAKKKTTIPDIGKSAVKGIARKFRKAKKKKNEWIEKRKHAIDTLGELQGITFKGLQTLKMFPELRTPKRTKKRKEAVRKAVRKGYIIKPQELGFKFKL